MILKMKMRNKIFGILITIFFAVIVNIVTYFSLKKIDMIESLKSVEQNLTNKKIYDKIFTRKPPGSGN